MGPVASKAGADLRRRPLQSFVIGLVLFLASASATMALLTLVESQAPFDRAFTAANGAHLVVDYDGRVPGDRLRASAERAVVTDSAGPWPVREAGLRVERGGAIGGFGGGFFPGGGAISGRDRPDTSVDRIVVHAGRWWTASGEIVVSERWAGLAGAAVGDLVAVGQGPGGDPAGGPLPPGLRPPGVPGTPSGSGESDPDLTLRIVGIAASVSTPRVVAWMSPADLAAVDPSSVPAQQMLYRVEHHGTESDLANAIEAVSAGLPPGSIGAASTSLARKAAVDRTAALFVPILLAFSIFALLAAAFIIVNTVGGIVLAEYRAIGVMKAIGFTPGQVRLVLLLEILVPVTAGSAFGVVVGTLASQPVLSQTAHSLGLPAPFALSVPIAGGVLAATAALATLAAFGPATRAGRLTVTQALTRGSAPSTTADGGPLRRVALSLPVRAPLRLGVAAGVAHPARAAMTFGALVVGVAAMVFTVSLEASLRQVAIDLIRDQASPVRAERHDPAVDGSAVTAALASDRRTARVVALTQIEVAVDGLAAPLPFVGYEGDASWIGYALISGRWFSGPGEAVAPTNFFRQGGFKLGDEITISRGERTSRVTLVGEIFDQPREATDALVIRGHADVAAALDPDATPTRWEMQPTAGIPAQVYALELRAVVGGRVGFEVVEDSATSEGFLLFHGVVAVLGIVLLAVSTGGVFSMVLLDTRRRVRATAILRTMGMTTRDVVLMTVSTVFPAAVLAGAVGLPLGLLMQRAVLAFMGEASSRTGIPAGVIDVLPIGLLGALALSGLGVAVVGAFVPARRAARSTIAPLLQAE